MARKDMVKFGYKATGIGDVIRIAPQCAAVGSIVRVSEL